MLFHKYKPALIKTILSNQHFKEISPINTCRAFAGIQNNIHFFHYDDLTRIIQTLCQISENFRWHTISHSAILLYHWHRSDSVNRFSELLPVTITSLFWLIALYPSLCRITYMSIAYNLRNRKLVDLGIFTSSIWELFLGTSGGSFLRLLVDASQSSS